VQTSYQTTCCAACCRHYSSIAPCMNMCLLYLAAAGCTTRGVCVCDAMQGKVAHLISTKLYQCGNDHCMPHSWAVNSIYC
jgi:hypothetical protein